MRKYIVLLLINGIVWAQTDYDKLVLKNGKEYLGEYVKTERKMLYFKPQEEISLRVIPTRDVQTLELQDGTFVKINVRTNSDSLPPKLTIEEKAVYDSKRDAKKWLAYPTFALLSSGGLATTTFFVGEDIVDYDNLLILIPSMVVSGSLGLVGSYNLFSKLDKKNIEGTSAKDIELYKETYSRGFKKRKLKNIIYGFGLNVLIPATGLLILILTSSGGGGGGSWLNCGPPCGEPVDIDY